MITTFRGQRGFLYKFNKGMYERGYLVASLTKNSYS